MITVITTFDLIVLTSSKMIPLYLFYFVISVPETCCRYICSHVFVIVCVCVLIWQESELSKRTFCPVKYYYIDIHLFSFALVAGRLSRFFGSLGKKKSFPAPQNSVVNYEDAASIEDDQHPLEEDTRLGNLI